MAQQLTRRFSVSVDYPIFLSTRRPDLRRKGRLEKGEEGYLITVNLTEGKVILFDQGLWSKALSTNIIPRNIFDPERIKMLDRYEVGLLGSTHEITEAEVISILPFIAK